MGMISAFLDVLFPPRCVFCRELVRNSGNLICSGCGAELPFTERCGEQQGNFFELCVAPLYYEGKVRDSLLRYKFHGASHYAAAYGALLADCVRERLTGEYDLISWVPLSRRRLRERGYDQARLLAEALSREIQGKTAVLLEKRKNTVKQSTLGSAEQRRANIAGAYRALEKAPIAGRRVLLIDDIVTTGSTLSECARTLKEAGAAKVFCAALARSRE